MDAADEKLVAEIRSLGDRASNAERRLVAMVDTLSARLALAEVVIEAARRLRLTNGQWDSQHGIHFREVLGDYDSAKGTGSGLSPAAKAGEHLQSPEPAPLMGPRREEALPAFALLPEPPAQVCAHPGVMRRCEWLTSSGGVPARIYCQSCDQTLYPPAATPAVPTPIDPVRDVIGDYRCGVDGCTISVRRPGERCYRHVPPAVPAEPVYRPDLAPRYTRQEVDAILKGLRERCMHAACDGVHRNLGCAEMTGRVRDVNLWPVTEPKRKE